MRLKWLFLFILSLNFTLYAQHNSQNISLVGRYTEGTCFSGTYDGNFLYVNNGGSLEIYNYSSFESPSLLGSLTLPALNYDFQFLNNYLYAANSEGGLLIINVSEKANPFIEGTFEVENARGLYVVDNTNLYLAAGNDGLILLNIFDKSNPIEVARKDQVGYGYDVLVDNQKIYYSAGFTGLKIFELVDDELVELGYVNPGVGLFELAKKDNYILACAETDGLRIIDVTASDNPEEVADYFFDFEPEDLIVDGDYAYGANGNRGVKVLDISDPENPVEIDNYSQNNNWVSNLSLTGDILFAAEQTAGFTLYDVQNPLDFTELSHLSLGNLSKTIAVSENYIFVGDEAGNMKIFDAANMSNPELINSVVFTNQISQELLRHFSPAGSICQTNHGKVNFS